MEGAQVMFNESEGQDVWPCMVKDCCIACLTHKYLPLDIHTREKHIHDYLRIELTLFFKKTCL